MVSACLSRTFSSFSLASFSEEDRAYYKGMAFAGTVFAAGVFLSWQKAAVTVLGALALSGKTISVFPNFQSRVESFHIGLIQAASKQENLEAFKTRLNAFERELARLPEEKRTPYQIVVLRKMRDFLLADSQGRADLLAQLKRLYAYELRQKEREYVNSSFRFNIGAFKVWTLGLSSLVFMPMAGLVVNWKLLSFYSMLPGVLSLTPFEGYTFKRAYSLLNHRSMKEQEVVGIALTNDLGRLMELTNTKNHRAFQDCQDVPSFFRILFKGTSTELPKDWPKLVGKLKRSAALEKFAKEAATQIPGKFLHGREFFARLIQTDKSVNAIVRLLKESNPLFKRVWELAGKPRFRECHEVPTAQYDAKTHTIEINQERAITRKVSDILFEVFNALQRTSCYEIESLANDQNEFALLTEWMEHFSLNGQYMLEHSMGAPKKSFNFPQMWQIVSSPQASDPIPIVHAERYRIMWMVAFLFNNPEFLTRRLRELA